LRRLVVALPLVLAAAHAALAADPRVELRTNQGTIVIELYPGKSPKTVANFLQYVKDGHYDGTVFHRVIPGFMIQGGGLDKELREKPTRAPVENEAANGLKNDYGTLAMARTPDPNSATPQGYGYAVFGKVVSGMDVVEKIARVPTGDARGHQNVPRDPVIIESATVVAAAAKK
jgi:peptidyl-prolyl cis-trans isomerase A (cyclophilin A)